MEEDGGGEAAAGPEAERALEAFAGASDAPQGFRTIMYVEDNPVCCTKGDLPSFWRISSFIRLDRQEVLYGCCWAFPWKLVSN